jgi:hypothetical protein
VQTYPKGANCRFAASLHHEFDELDLPRALLAVGGVLDLKLNPLGISLSATFGSFTRCRIFLAM